MSTVDYHSGPPTTPPPPPPMTKPSPSHRETPSPRTRNHTIHKPEKKLPKNRELSSLLTKNRHTQQDIIHRGEKGRGYISQNEAFQALNAGPLQYEEILKHLDNHGELKDKRQLIEFMQSKQVAEIVQESKGDKTQEKAMLEEKLARVKASLADVVEEENQRLRKELAELESELREMYGVETKAKMISSASTDDSLEESDQENSPVVPALDLSPIIPRDRRRLDMKNPVSENGTSKRPALRIDVDSDDEEDKKEESEDEYEEHESDGDNENSFEDGYDDEIWELQERLKLSARGMENSAMSTPRHTQKSMDEERKVLKLKRLLRKTMSVLEFYRNISEQQQQQQQQSPSSQNQHSQFSVSPRKAASPPSNEGKLTSENQLAREVEKMNLQMNRVTQELRLRNVQNSQMEQEIRRLRYKMDSLRRKYVICKQENLVMSETLREQEQREQEHLREKRRLEFLEQQAEEAQQENENLLLSVKLLQTQSRMLRSQLDSAEANKRQAERHAKRLERLLQNLKIGPLKQLQDSQTNQSLRHSQNHSQSLQRSQEHEGEIAPPYALSSARGEPPDQEESIIENEDDGTVLHVELNSINGEVYVSDGRRGDEETIRLDDYLATLMRT